MQNLNDRIRNRKARRKIAARTANEAASSKYSLVAEMRKEILDYVIPYGFHEYGPTTGSDYMTLWKGSILRGDKRTICCITIGIKKIDGNDLACPKFISSDDYPFPGHNSKFNYMGEKSYKNETSDKNEFFWRAVDEMIVEYGSASDENGNNFRNIAILVIIFLSIYIALTVI